MSPASNVPGAAVVLVFLKRAAMTVQRHPLAAAGVALVALVAVVLLGRAGGSGDDESPSIVQRPLAGSDTLIVLDSAALRLAGIRLYDVVPLSVGSLVANGTISFDENHVSVVAPRAEGRVITVSTDLGRKVSAGSALAVLESAEVGQARGDYQRAVAATEGAKRNYERERRLFEQSITPEKEMLDAEVEYRTAQADMRSATARLRSVGAMTGSGAAYTLLSPISGSVVARSAMTGQVVGPATTLFTIADLRHVWITVDVYEQDLSRVTTGASALVTTAAFPGESFTGRVTYSGGVVDPLTHTFKVRVEVHNEAQRLRPGVFAQVRIASPASVPGNLLGVPEAAVQDMTGRTVVFVAQPQPGRFVVRPVVIGAALDSSIVSIRSGLRAGERVVTDGAFQLKAELMKANNSESE